MAIFLFFSFLFCKFTLCVCIFDMKFNPESLFQENCSKGGLVPIKLNDNVHDVDVSIDGTWQRRGHSSPNGITTVSSADSGKCIDFQVLTKSCKSCQYWDGKILTLMIQTTCRGKIIIPVALIMEVHQVEWKKSAVMF